MSEDGVIPFIHNYCDRWCSRCDFITRCSVGIIEIRLSDTDNLSNEEFKELYTKTIDEVLGLDIGEEGDDESFFEEEDFEDFDYEPPTEEERHEAKVQELLEETHPIATLSLNYLEIGLDLIEVLKLEKSNELEIINWYLHFIHVKIRRALSGLNNSFYDDEFIDDPHQKDSNGSAKVALIAIDKSILAWQFVNEKYNLPQIEELIAMLKNLAELTKQTFPDFDKFIRPGFDQ